MKAPRIKLTVTIALILIGVIGFAWTQVSIFLVQPIGALPEGRTLIIGRTGNLRFIDSADAICERTAGGVSLLCRAAVLGKIAETSIIHARLPYSETLYRISAGGVTYDR